MENNLPIYNSNDLIVRKAIAISGLTSYGGKLADKARAGATVVKEQKLFEMGMAQIKCIMPYKALATTSKGIFKPLDNIGIPILDTLLINGIEASNPFEFSNSNLDTAANLTEAINSYISIPDYKASLIGKEVVIESINKGKDSNGYSMELALSPIELIFSAIDFNGGQDGVSEEDNNLTEPELNEVFNNISHITGVGYAPLGTNYKII